MDNSILTINKPLYLKIADYIIKIFMMIVLKIISYHLLEN
jgi:hypothetical protein